MSAPKADTAGRTISLSLSRCFIGHIFHRFPLFSYTLIFGRVLSRALCPPLFVPVCLGRAEAGAAAKSSPTPRRVRQANKVCSLFPKEPPSPGGACVLLRRGLGRVFASAPLVPRRCRSRRSPRTDARTGRAAAAGRRRSRPARLERLRRSRAILARGADVRAEPVLRSADLSRGPTRSAFFKQPIAK